MLGPKLREADFLVPISKYNVEYMADLLGDWVREKCHVIHCGVDPLKYEKEFTHKTSEDEAFQILQIGTLHWKKGQLHLVQSMARLRDLGVPFQLRIIGEGEERESIEAEINKFDLKNYVLLLGAKTQSEVAELLKMADCYVQSSVSEGIPVAIMEAMASKLPVVSTKITGIPELVIDEKTGILVNPTNIEDMTNALQTLFENPSLRHDMGEKGHEWVMAEFNLQKNSKKLIMLFENLVHQHN
jgi:glycosyltransferase involved in cell wall biosynthesis